MINKISFNYKTQNAGNNYQKHSQKKKKDVNFGWNIKGIAKFVVDNQDCFHPNELKNLLALENVGRKDSKLVYEKKGNLYTDIQTHRLIFEQTDEPPLTLIEKDCPPNSHYFFLNAFCDFFSKPVNVDEILKTSSENAKKLQSEGYVKPKPPANRSWLDKLKNISNK